MGSHARERPGGGPRRRHALARVRGGGAPGVGGAAQPPEVPQDGEDAPVLGARVGQPELREDRRHVLLGAAQRDPGPLGDRRVRAALGEELEHLALARGERLQRPVVVAGVEQPRDDVRVERGPAGGDAAQRAGEVVEVGHAVLEQVAEPGGVLGEHARRDAVLDVRGEHDDRDARVARADRPRGDAAPPRCGSGASGCRRSPRRARARRRGEQLVGGPGLGRHLEPGLAEQRGDPLADEQVVVRDHDPHGSSALTVVPAAGRADTRSRPSSASTRSASPRSPLPRASSAPPTPSSAISIVGEPVRPPDAHR